MTLIVDATYENGVLKPKQPVPLPEGAEVRLSIVVPDEERDPLENVIGIGDGPIAGDTADRHDELVYGDR